MLLSIWLEALGKYWKKLSCGAVLRLSSICLKTENYSLINWQVDFVHKYCSQRRNRLLDWILHGI